MVRQLILLTCLLVAVVYAAPFRDDDDYEDEANEQQIALLEKELESSSYKYFVCKSSSGKFPDPRDCSHYYECKKWKPKHKKCDRHELFDPKKQKCMDKKKVKCEYGDLTTTISPKSTKNIISSRTTYRSKSSSSSSSSDSSDSSSGSSDSSDSSSSEHKEVTTPLTDESGETEIDESDETVNVVSIFSTEGPSESTNAETTLEIITESTPGPSVTDEDEFDIDIGVTAAGTEGISKDISVSKSKSTTASQLEDATDSGEQISTRTNTVTAEGEITTASKTIDDVGQQSTYGQTVSVSDAENVTSRTTYQVSSTSNVYASTKPHTPVYTTSTNERHQGSTTSNKEASVDASTGDIEVSTITLQPECIIPESRLVPDLFECPVEDGHYPHPDCDNLFIHCDQWMPYLKKCADGLTFSKEFRLCLWPEEDVFKEYFF